MKAVMEDERKKTCPRDDYDNPFHSTTILYSSSCFLKRCAVIVLWVRFVSCAYLGEGHGNKQGLGTKRVIEMDDLYTKHTC